MKTYLEPEAARLGVLPLMAPRDGDAGYDIRSAEEIVLLPGEQRSVRTGLHIELPKGYVGLFKDRSLPMAQKQIYIHSGVIDSSFRGEIKVIIENGGADAYTIRPNDKIVQMIVVHHYSAATESVASLEELEVSDRGEKGFGSTGKS